MIATFLLIWGLCAAGAAVLWAVSVKRRDASVIDIFWGPGFVLAALVAWIRGGKPEDAWHLLGLGMVAVWGLRLAFHIFFRARGKGEDRRYAAMRERHGARFWWLSLFTVFLLQATLVALLAAPLVIVQLRPILHPAWCLAGFALWLVGFLFEAVADAQLVAFQKDPESRGRVLDSGLWHYSRHPNYFGETILWWGFGAFALAVAGSAWTLYAPLVITVLLLRVSGVPMLEAGMAERRPGYRDYIERTPSFVPWLPRRKGEAR